VSAIASTPDTSFTGRVRQVVPTADRQKATVLVKVSILDRDRILPEMGHEGRVAQAADPTVAAAPRRHRASTALITGASSSIVWVVETGAAKRSPNQPARAGDRVKSAADSPVASVSSQSGLKDGEGSRRQILRVAMGAIDVRDVLRSIAEARSRGADGLSLDVAKGEFGTHVVRQRRRRC
jgi:hypothetical protein